VSDFWLGLVVGFIAAGIFGFAAQWFSLRQAEWQDMNKPQKITLLTKKTPLEVVLAGLRAGLLIILAIVVIGVFVWLVLESPW